MKDENYHEVKDVDKDAPDCVYQRGYSINKTDKVGNFHIEQNGSDTFEEAKINSMVLKCRLIIIIVSVKLVHLLISQQEVDCKESHINPTVCPFKEIPLHMFHEKHVLDGQDTNHKVIDYKHEFYLCLNFRMLKVFIFVCWSCLQAQ